MKNKILMNTLTLIFIVAVPFVLLMTALQAVAFDRAYYQREYIKYSIPQSMGIEMPELMQSTDKLLKYINNKRADINFKAMINGRPQEFFSQRDKIHMVDVKGLFVKGFFLRNALIIYLLLFLLLIFRMTKNRGKRLAKACIASFVVGIVPIIGLMILMNIDFYKYFTIFHQIFFNNDFWLLDPLQDTLVNMFPENFFLDMAFKIAYFYLAGLFALLLGGIGYLRFYRKKSNQ